jgi:hypothetical protein
MKEGFFKNILLKLIFLLLIISQIKCEEDFLEEGRGGRRDEDEDEDDRPDMMKMLEELKAEIQNINKDIAKYDTLIYVLVPVSCLLFLILLGFSAYEIFRCCKKKEGDLIDTTKNGNYLYSENNNFTKLKNSSTDSSSVKENQNQEVKNSFHSSKVTESIASKEVLKSDIFNSRKEKGNLNESNNLNPDVGGYVAPSIEEMNKNQQNKEEGKFLTNMGDEEPGKQKENFMPNPFLK